ncbi:hypothetical protein EV401DRAFT_2201901 [Pisolithus croceorrhizus]|nr:hypothetical protein EV401DRAFT_2201901 [Pisolithus croceorrhizus]
MKHSRQPLKPSRRNRGLVGSFDDLVLAEKVDKGPGKILPSVPPTSSRSLSENAPALVPLATSEHEEDRSHRGRQFLDGKPQEELPGGFEPMKKVVDSVRRPSSPNGEVASALRPNTSASSSRLRPRTEQQSQAVQPASKMIASQKQPKVTPQSAQSLPVATPLRPKRDAPAVCTRSSQPKCDTSTSDGQNGLPFTTPPLPNLDTLAVSTVKSSQPKPDTPTSRGQKKLPLMTPPGSSLDTPAVSSMDSLEVGPSTPASSGQKSPPSMTPPQPAPTVSTVYSSRSDPDTPPVHGANSPHSIPVADVPSQSAVVTTPTRRRVSPSSSSASASPGRVTAQCGATTMSNEPCSQIVTLPPTHAMLDPIPAAYCCHHNEVKETGFYVTGVSSADRYVEFKDYVPEYLKVDTQVALEEEMAKVLSKSDGPGYIYVFEIRDPSNTHFIKFKVGRTVNLRRRLVQWDKQCGPQEHVLRGWWPGIIEPDSDNGTNGTLLRTQMKPGYPGLLSHRLERLVHLELLDLFYYAPYLEPEWPKTNNSKQLPSVAGSLSNAPLAVQKPGPCTDCGAVHREIFSFRRPKGGNGMV